MMRWVIVLLVALGVARAEVAGTLLSEARSVTMSAAQVAMVYRLHGQTAPADTHALAVYAVTYATVDVAGAPTTASGMIAVPTDVDAPLPLVSYQHAMTTLRDAVPSAYPLTDETAAVVLVYAARGYAVAAADYLGLGRAPGVHPFLHAASEASACEDLLRAAMQVFTRHALRWNRQLFLAGYSQGGHATLALLRRLQEGGAFPVTAVAAGSGPYVLSRLLGDTPTPLAAAYLANLLLAYSRVYRLYPDDAALFTPAYAGVPALFDGTHPLAEILRALPTDMARLYAPIVLRHLRDPASRLRRAIAANDVDRFTPAVPVRLYYAADDEAVSPRHALLAAAAMGPRVTAINIGPYTHVKAYLPTQLATVTWFDELR
jgi:hypothetical protein